MRDVARARRDLLALTVLVLLVEAPRHPYAIQGLIRERNQWFAEAPARRLYHVVDRLVRNGFMAPVETTREGRRPERTVYQITPEGEEEVKAWLTELLRTPSFDLTLLIAACALIGALTPEDATQSLNTRLAWLDRDLAAREAAVRQASSFLPRLFLIEEEYARTMLAAERDWIAGLLDAITTGEIAWDAAEMTQQAEADRSERREDHGDGALMN